MLLFKFGRTLIIAVSYMLDQDIAAGLTDIQIHIGQAGSFRIKKSFKKEVVFKRVNLDQIREVRYQRTDNRPSAGADGYVGIMSKYNKIPDDKKVLGKVLLGNYLEFMLEALLHLVQFVPGGTFVFHLNTIFTDLSEKF